MFEWFPAQSRFHGDVSFFYHNIKNQINSVLVATDVNNHAIYTYRNHDRSYYKGVEVNLSYFPIKNLELNVGYQYLIAKDKGVEDEIREGGLYHKPLFNPHTGEVNYSPTKKDYWGMENRSRHMLNARAFYTYTPWDVTLNVRANYRGKYPYRDSNNNGFIDRFDTFVRSHVLLNAGVEKKLMKRFLSVRFNAENILDFVDAKVPSQPGRMFFVGVVYNWVPF